MTDVNDASEVSREKLAMCPKPASITLNANLVIIKIVKCDKVK